ncbi:MAG: SMC-Scp complex subunit ScpB [Deltaproteobacteria bacterium]|nr:SMC-Scp complex subunit ScpB [Deltaproteobacteria bacterium]MBW2219855.1 SMC-Scp complex subunit ScpB [Deltaproteobacteria bacterium]
MDNLKHIIESLIFVSGNPLSIEQIKAVIPEPDTKEIKQCLLGLIQEYEERSGGFYLRHVAGAYQFRSRPEYKNYITKLVQASPLRLSKAALETLAIIAYKQPAIRSDIEHIRGVDCGGIIRTLMEHKLIRVLGRKDIPGRPLIYSTTKRFLELFDLSSLRDLPTLKEIEAFEREPMETSDLIPEKVSESGSTDNQELNADNGKPDEQNKTENTENS